ncbi:MAG: hypothetical protein R2747_13175 [Pyrinomonadaceae bacterium]
MKFRTLSTLFILTICAFAFQQASAQSTIFNVASTDVVAEKSFYIESDYVAHFGSYANGGFQTYGLRGVYGVGKNVEVGANVFVSRNESGTPVEIQPNLKWKAYSNEKHGVAVSGGTVLFVPLNKKAGDRVTGMVYANVSKVVKSTNGTRLTSGVYTMVGAEKEAGTKTGVMLGVEQPVHRKVNLIADWYSGKNRIGYAATGFSVTLSPKQTLFAGYNFGNSGRGNNALSIFYSYTF